jgi:hypothetical protein
MTKTKTKTTPNPRRLSIDEVSKVVGGTAGGGSNNDPLVGGNGSGGLILGPGYESSTYDTSGDTGVPGNTDDDSLNGGN